MEKLLEAIASHPDDLATWSVYADHLQSSGDPRGELISLMLKREQTPTQQLFEAQRRWIKRHERTFSFGNDALRRGFVSELRIEAVDELAKLDQLAHRFVDRVTLAISGDDWDAWCEAFATKRPWRWLSVEFTSPPEELTLAPLFACCPAVEHVRLKFEEAVELDWSGVEAPALMRLVLVDAGHVDQIADFSALRELWLLGETEAGGSLFETWEALERIVVANEVAEAPDNVVVYSPTEEPYDESYEPTAMFFVDGDLDLAIVQKLVTRMSGIDHASIRIGKLWWLRRPVSVVQMYGQQSDALLPFGLALGLYNLTGNHSPIAMFEMLAEQAQALVFGEPLARPTLDAGELPVSLARRAFDLAFGYDPGKAILDEAFDALAIAKTQDLVGTLGSTIALTIIDPDVEPLTVAEGDDDGYENRDPLDQDSDGDEDYASDFEDAEVAAYEEPIPVERAIVQTDDPALIEADAVAEAEANDVVLEEPDEEPAELDTEEVSERPEQWFEFRDNWELRATDPDDESGEVRWPDPEVAAHAAEDIDTFVAKPECEKHGVVLEACNACGGPTCEECDKPRIEGTCPACVLEIEKAKPVEQAHHHGRVVD